MNRGFKHSCLESHSRLGNLPRPESIAKRAKGGFQWFSEVKERFLEGFRHLAVIPSVPVATIAMEPFALH